MKKFLLVLVIMLAFAFVSTFADDTGGGGAALTIYENGAWVGGIKAAMKMGGQNIEIDFETAVSAAGYTKIIFEFKSGGGFNRYGWTGYEIDGNANVQDWSKGNVAVNTATTSTISLGNVNEIKSMMYHNNGGTCKDTDLVKIYLE